MPASDVLALLPLIAVAAGSVAVMIAATFRSHALAAGLAALSLAAAFALVPAVSPLSPRQVTPLLSVDRYALFCMGLIFASGFAVVLISFGYLRDRPDPKEEFYFFLLLAVLGSAVLAGSRHFASFFLGLELLSVSLYAMVAYPREGDISLEAGLKYLILAGASSAFLLFGMALVYARCGTMEFVRPGASLSLAGGFRDAYLLAGLGLILAGAGFKLGVVPFHLWTPDVYEGAPAPATAFVATVSKGAMAALLLRYVVDAGAYDSPSALAAINVVAVASILAGNLLALLQSNVKRILAYSSIAHLGYLLVALAAGGPLAWEAVMFYLVAYFITTLAAFGVVTVMSGPDRDADAIDDYRGLFLRRPWLAGIFSAALLSLAGVPLTAGFVGKFYILAAGIRVEAWLPVVTLVLGSTIGLFYYLRIIVAVYSRLPGEGAGTAPFAPAVPLAGIVTLAGLVLLLVGIGVYPAPLLRLIQAAAAGLVPGP
ncbi:MAG: NADH-quinone oxidoreductase subunit N [Deltaproteobacteria bacterium]|nr:NADH-quinone oxidoreductase subunit N [Deltaproteobacteria bacterium]